MAPRTLWNWNSWSTKLSAKAQELGLYPGRTRPEWKLATDCTGAGAPEMAAEVLGTTMPELGKVINIFKSDINKGCLTFAKVQGGSASLLGDVLRRTYTKESFSCVDVHGVDVASHLIIGLWRSGKQASKQMLSRICSA